MTGISRQLKTVYLTKTNVYDNIDLHIHTAPKLFIQLVAGNLAADNVFTISLVI